MVARLMPGASADESGQAPAHDRGPSALEALAGLLLANLPDFVVHMRADGTIVRAGGATETRLPIPVGAMPGRRIASFLPPDVTETFLDAIAAAVESGQQQRIDYRLVIGERTHDREARIMPLAGEGVLAVIRDTTEQRAAAEALRRRDAILQAVSAAAERLLHESLEDCAAGVLGLLGSASGASGAGIFEFHESGGVLVQSLRYEWSGAGGSPTIDQWQAIPLESYLEANPFRAVLDGTASQGHTRDLPQPMRGELEQLGIASTLSVPIVVEADVWGDIALDSAVEREWSAAEVDALVAASALLAGAIRRGRAEEALRVSEDQLRQAHKLEAVGRLAGGIAHDFNNLLTAITGHGELAAATIDDPESVQRALDEILQAAKRAASLTDQLLAFSRQQVSRPKPLDVNAIVDEMAGLLRRLLAENIELITSFDRSIGLVEADASQLHQVLLNLALNARDALPSGGRLALVTTDVRLAQPPEGVAIPPGRYVLVTVADSGLGMESDVRERAFEPFFTTKEVGKGVGLGLATVHGIVTQAGGEVALRSAPGAGTTVEIYLPCCEPEIAPTADATVSGRVLVVEDEDQVREIVARSLEQAGYDVLVSADPRRVLELDAAELDSVALLVSDVVMPGLSGPELASRLRARNPALRVLFVSGYAEDRDRLLAIPGAGFLAKPFTPTVLAQRVREALGR
jgi:signal transduction histidine kinase